MRISLTITAIGIFLSIIAKIPPLESSIQHSQICSFDEQICFSEVLHEKKLIKSAKYVLKHNQIEEGFYQTYLNNKYTKSLLTDYTLPVVIHIIHQNGPENITNMQVELGVEHLNKAFANTGYYDQGTGLDTKIQFCLAERDPNGNITTGITRTVSSLTELTINDDLMMKDLIRWDPTKYINIWLVKEIENSVVGYAYLPTSHGQPEDGIVIESEYFGSSNSNSSVIIHEMGHYLGLYHTFKGGCKNDDCLIDGDRVCDTPPDQTTIPAPCQSVSNSCTTDTNSGFASDQPDMFYNYLDYGDFSCYSAFTQGQTDRMTYFIENIRHSLITSNSCIPPCTNPISVAFNSSNTNVDVGSTVYFNNLSTGGANYTWYINNDSFASSINSSYTFFEEGLYEITLIASTNDPNCIDSTTQIINVACPINAQFSTNNLYPSTGELVSFTNTSSNGFDYTWSINGNNSASTNNFNYIFTTIGSYTVCLEVNNNLCKDVFCQLIFVHDDNINDDCNGTFINKIGDLGKDVKNWQLINFNSDNYLLAGSEGSMSALTLVNNNGEVITHRTFDFTNGNDFIANIAVDSDGFIVGTSRDQLNTNTVNVLFKYDWVNDNIIWSKEITNPAFTRFEGMYENPDNGNHIFYGMTTPASIDYYLIELNKNTGEVEFQKRIDHGGNADVLASHITLDNCTYMVGQARLGGGLDEIRSSLIKFDHSGNMEWVKVHLKSPSVSARLYNTDLVFENDTIVIIGRGSLTDANLVNSRLMFYKTNLDGDIYLAKSYTITNGNTVTGHQIEPLPDGYIITGRYMNSNNLSKIYFAKIDKEGNVIWAKSLITNGDESNPWMTINGGYIVFSTDTDAFSPLFKDIIFGQIQLNGEIDENCDIFEEISLNSNIILNPYSGFEQPSLFSPNYTWYDKNIIPSAGNLFSEAIPGCECTNFVMDTCANGAPLHLVPDAMLNQMNGDCTINGIEVMFEICNIDSTILPESTPISFYGGDPTLSTPQLLGTFELGIEIQSTECQIYQVILQATSENEIFAVVNDNGSSQLPINLMSQLPNTQIEECDYQNNINSFIVNSTSPDLNLGSDITICQFEATELDAGSGFATYSWSNGSNEQSTTVWEPGTYWVEAIGFCGYSQRDTIIISVDSTSRIDIGTDTAFLCINDSLEISLSGYSNYIWSPFTYLNCDTCSTITVSPDTTMFYYLMANSNGCYSADSILIQVIEIDSTFEIIEFCSGDTITIFGNEINLAGDYSANFISHYGCDSIHTISLVEKTDTVLLIEDLNICEGDTVNFFGELLFEPNIYYHYDNSGSCVIHNQLNLEVTAQTNTFDSISICENEYVNIFGNITNQAGTYSMTFTNTSGCDSIHQIILNVEQVINELQTITICQNDYADIFGNPINLPGIYTDSLTTQYGCDSIINIELIVLDTYIINEEIEICSGDSVLIFGDYTSEAGIYSNTYQSYSGCDSIVNLNLISSESLELFFNVSHACSNQSDGSLSIEVLNGKPPYTYEWNIPNSNNNSSISELASGIYTVTVTDNNNCHIIGTSEVSEIDVNPNINSINNLCNGDSSGIIQVTLPNLNNYLFSINDSNYSSTSYFENLIAGEYSVSILEINSDCIFNYEIIIEEPQPLFVQLPNNISLELGNSVQITTITSNNSIYFNWSPETWLSCENCQNPISNPDSTILYTVEVSDSNNCIVSDSILISVYFDPKIYIPNSFSPNGDGINDTFIIFSDDVAEVENLLIFDRWGELVFESSYSYTNDLSLGWDGTFKGKKMNTGVFVYSARLRLVNGKVIDLKGDLNLIR